MPSRPRVRTRRWQATLIITLVFTAAIGAAAVGWWYARESPPHQGPILLISVDQLAPESLAAYGAERSNQSSDLDAFASDAVVFDQAYAHGFQVLPTHASVLTGQLPFQHGVRDDAGFVLKPEARTLAEVLK